MAFLCCKPASSFDVRGRKAWEAQGHAVAGGRLRDLFIIGPEAGHGDRFSLGQKPKRVTGMKGARKEEPGRDGPRPGQAKGAIEGHAYRLGLTAGVLGEACCRGFQGLPESLKALGIMNAGGDHGGRREAIAFQERAESRSRGLLLRFARQVGACQGDHEARKGKALETP